MFSYWIQDTPAVTDIPQSLKARLSRHRQVKEKEAVQVKRLWHSNTDITPGSESDRPPATPTFRPNKVSRMRLERTRAETNLRPQPSDWDLTDAALVHTASVRSLNKSSSYILHNGPSVTGLPYVIPASRWARIYMETNPDPSLLAIIGARIARWTMWAEIKLRLHAILSPLMGLFSYRRRVDKSTSTKSVSDISPSSVRYNPPKPRVDSWQRGRPKSLQTKSSSRTSGPSSTRRNSGPSTANIMKVTRDPKTKIVTVWTVEKSKTPRPRTPAPTDTRRWRF